MHTCYASSEAEQVKNQIKQKKNQQQWALYKHFLPV